MLYIIVFALIGLTKVHPLGPILLSSFALSTNALTFTASIPVLVGTDRLIGTAFGVWKSFVSRISCLYRRRIVNHPSKTPTLSSSRWLPAQFRTVPRARRTTTSFISSLALSLSKCALDRCTTSLTDAGSDIHCGHQKSAVSRFTETPSSTTWTTRVGASTRSQWSL